MEVGQESVDDMEWAWWGDEEAGASGEFAREIGGLACGTLERPEGGGTNGDDAATAGFGGGDYIGGGLGDGEPFLVHGMFGEEFGFDGSEGTEADVQGDVGDIGTPVLK